MGLSGRGGGLGNKWTLPHSRRHTHDRKNMLVCHERPGISIHMLNRIITRVCTLPHVVFGNASEPCLLGQLENRGRHSSKEMIMCRANVPK